MISHISRIALRQIVRKSRNSPFLRISLTNSVSSKRNFQMYLAHLRLHQSFHFITFFEDLIATLLIKSAVDHPFVSFKVPLPSNIIVYRGLIGFFHPLIPNQIFASSPNFGIPHPLQTFNPESHPEFWPSNKRQILDPENHIGDPMRSSYP